jgi:alpha-tubulin suppressor-like RCC1 family protein
MGRTRHFLFLTDDRKFRSGGDGLSGQLGNGGNSNSNRPVGVVGIVNGSGAGCGATHTAVVADGSVYTFGRESKGRLGRSELARAIEDGGSGQSGRAEVRAVDEGINIPGIVLGIECALSVACGGEHTAVLLQNGTVMTFGDNTYGQLGDGTNEQRNEPVTVCQIINATAVACGTSHTAVILENGTICTFGLNSNGQLGNGTQNDSNLPVVVSVIDGSTSALRATAVACGDVHTLALMEDGTVQSFGFNESGQLGDGGVADPQSLVPIVVSGITTAQGIACGGWHSAVLTQDMTVHTFGQNTYGQLGDGTNGPRYASVEVCGINNAVSIACGEDFTAVLLDDGTVRSFGDNTVGQLGDGTNDQSNVPTEVILEPVARSLSAKSSLSVKVFRLWDSLLSSIYCVHQDNLVRTKRGSIPIKDVVAGDTVYDEKRREVAVKYNIKISTPNKDYVKIEKGALKPNIPANDLYIVKGHPIRYNKKEIDCEKLVGLVQGVSEVTLDKFSYVYCLCTEKRDFVFIENVPVCTRTVESWEEIVKDGKVRWSKQ